MPEAELVAVGAEVAARRGRHVLAAVPEAGLDSLRRLGFAQSFGEFLGVGSVGSVGSELPFDAGAVVQGSYAVRVHGATAEVREVLYAAVWDALRDPVVRLREPLTDLVAVVEAGSVWWGRLVHAFRADNFASRAGNRRPFVRPVIVQPRKARCLVNLSGVAPGETLLDPFCGTGSLPIEAALIGARALASDVDPIMVAGTVRNARWAGVELETRVLDGRALRRWETAVDAIVTDVPYGRLASLHHTDRDPLYGEFLAAAADALRPGGRAVVMAPRGMLEEPPATLEVVDRFEEYVHRQLTREVVVMQRRA